MASSRWPRSDLRFARFIERRDVARIEGERRHELRLRRIVASQAVRIDDAAIEVDFLGLGHTAVERLLVRSERRLETPRLALQDRQVEPAVRQVGPAREQPLVGGLRLGQPAGALERSPRCAASPRVRPFVVVTDGEFLTIPSPCRRAADDDPKRRAEARRRVLHEPPDQNFAEMFRKKFRPSVS